MFTFNDIFKSGFLDNVSAFSLTDTVIALVLAFILGIFISYIYRKTFSGVMFSNFFSTSLIGLCMITTFVILAVTSNVVLSLGMVGALSIVRFRTAIKEPLDIVFLFWAIAVGIVLGAGLIPLAYVGSLLIGLILYIFSNKKGFDSPYVLVFNCVGDTAEQEGLKVLEKYIKKYKVKSKTINKNGTELTIEIRLHNNESDFVNEISKVTGISNVVLVSCNGNYMN